MRFQPLVVAIALFVVATTTHGEVYRWVDENGATIYSQTRPTSGVTVEIIKATPTKTSKGEESSPEDRLRQQTEASDEAKEQTESEDLEQEFKAEEARIKKENCKSARHNLKLYQTLGNRIVKHPDGTYKRYSEEERQEKITQAEKQISEFCE
ncbi:DUF4124 domain-containing protein [Solemya velesiana gill symbiont]|uniref:DUF4124 domain-containing protein n=1 Tax=Solemya velesiana gill symbiont TaxID=1918948 RepID=A0A1T2KRA9_9GAMM|nr:DUF4124 domain-containing protein [Solemya velesiana gill symbiont]OOZ35377.1 hypothetical protein BOW51_11470 [Solemya velesiana gill symbiont]